MRDGPRSVEGKIEMNEITINCFHCKYFYITWDKNFPNGCKAFGFKSKQMPAVVVRESSAENCGAFEKKRNPT